MNYLDESFIVGIYCIVVFLFVSYIGIIKNIYLMFFIVGFFKHFFGYFLRIQDYYCEKVCNKKNGIVKRNLLMITGESIIEGVVFVILGTLLSIVLKQTILLYFIIGVLLHITSEKIGLHTYFCNERCISS
jgi:hypothetical protein